LNNPKVKIRTIKRAHVHCECNEAHGKTPFELNIEVGSYNLKIWLCADCIINLKERLIDSITSLVKYRLEINTTNGK